MIPVPGTSQDDWFAQFNTVGSTSPYRTDISSGLDPSGGLQPDASQQAATSAMNQAALGTAAQLGSPIAPGGVTNWDQATFAAQFGQPKTPQELLALEQQLSGAGIKVLKNAAGVAGKIQLPNGQIVDVINAAGAGGNGFQWLTDGGGSNQMANLGYGFGSSMAPWTENFTPRDPSQIANDPAYKFQMEQGMKALQGSAAARGNLLSGGVLKGIEQFGQGLASTYNDKYYNRDLGEYGIRRDNFYNNQDRPFDKNVTLARLGQPT